MPKPKTLLDQLRHEENYVAFLFKRLCSKSYQANSTPAEYASTKADHDNAKFKLKMLREKAGIKTK